MKWQLQLDDTLRGRNALLIAAAIFLLNFGLKVLFLDTQPIADDEPFTLFWAQKPMGDIWEMSRQGNNPPLFYLIEHVWIQLWGWAPGSLRLPSLLCASLAAMLLFVSGNRHFGLYGALVASLLFTLSTEHVYYAHEVRMYALLSLLTVLAIDRYLSLVQEPQRWQQYVWLGAWNVLLLYTHFLGIWVLLAQVACWPLLMDRKRSAGRLLLMLLGVTVAFAPYLLAFLARLQAVQAEGTWVAAPHWTQLYGHINVFLNGPLGTLALLGMLGLGTIWMLIGKRSRAASLRLLLQHRTLLIAIALFSIMYGGIYVQSLVFSPAFIPRYLVFTSLPFFLAVAGMLHFLIPYTRLQLASLVLIVAAMLPGFSLNPSNGSDLKGLVAHLQSEKTGVTPLVICPEFFDKTYIFHADLAVFQDYRHFAASLLSHNIYPATYYTDIPPTVLAGADKVIFLDAAAQFVQPDNGILMGLKATFPHVQQQHFENVWDVYVAKR
jgi:hypothetical protein